jgi:L-lactate dehydrogenase
MIRPNDQRIAIIGAGHVGSTAAFALMLRALVSEIVLVDSDAALAEAEAADIGDANALARPARVFAGNYVDAATAAIAVITAGAATQGAESRLSVLSRSADIVGECVTRLMVAGFAGIIIVAANPVDIMADVAFRKAGLPAQRVIGTGTLLDSARLRRSLAEKLDVACSAITGLVLGEHGDSEVAAFSSVRVGGLTLENFANPGESPDYDATAKEVRDGAYRILAAKGYTSFGIATAIVRICEAIVRDEQAILPVSTLLTGEFGITNLYLSLPCILGTKGVERVLVPDISDGERRGLLRSADVLRRATANVAESGSR